MDYEEYKAKREELQQMYEERVITERERDMALADLTMDFIGADEPMRQARRAVI
jgi:hypothetical protein